MTSALATSLLGKFLTSVLTQALYGSQLCYVVSIGLTKMSTAFFIGHLSQYAPHFRISYLLAVVSGVWTVASTILIALRGNLSRPWATYDGSEALVGFIHIPSFLTLLNLNTPQYVRWIAIEAVGLVIEAALWGYSIDIVWGLQMKISKRILILCAFACRLLYIYPYLPSSSHHLTLGRLIPIIAIRLFYLSPSENLDPTVTSILPNIFTEASLEYSIISASVTCLKPFLRPFHSGFVDIIPSADSSLRSGIRAKTLETYMLGPISAGDQSGTTRTTTKRSSGTPFESKGGETTPPIQPLFQPNQLEGYTVNSAWSDAHRHETEPVRSVSPDHMIIRTTKNWSIQYEEG